ncbi:MAG: hypothetical protein VW779_09425, partial [Halieaceae bacterium]
SQYRTVFTDIRENLGRRRNLKLVTKRKIHMRYKIPADYNVQQSRPDAVEFFSQFANHTVSDFIPAQQSVFRLWQLAFNRALKSPASNPEEISGALADAELLLFFFSRFREPYAGFTNVHVLHPPTTFERLEWALKNVLSERVAGNLLPFTRERRPTSVLSGMKRWSLSGEVDAGADRIRQETIKLIVSIE